MTRDELIEEIKQRRSRLRPCGEGSIATVSDAVFTQCLGLAEELDFTPAMTWQDEPSGEGWYWVDGVSEPKVLWLCRGEWMVGVKKCGELTPLNGRRVCPIPAPPAPPKRGA